MELKLDYKIVIKCKHLNWIQAQIIIPTSDNWWQKKLSTEFKFRLQFQALCLDQFT